jgi:sigma-E factor negative regulatory protein RseB
VTPRLVSYPWRIATVAVVLGLLGSAIVTLALIDSATHPAAARRGSPGGGTPSAGPAAVSAAGAARVAAGAGQAAASSGRAAGVAQSPQVRAGQRLLREAAAACQDISYRGVQIMARWGEDGASTSVVDVWHLPGHGTLAKAADTETGPFGALQDGLSAEQDPDGILGVSGQLLVLMQANYEVVYAGEGTADNRPAQIVEVRRPSGGLAGRFWLDTATKLPLRRETFDTAAHVISEDAFITLTVGGHSLAGMPAATVRPWTGRVDQSALTSLRAGGWPLPRRLPGNLLMFASDETSSSSGEVVDLSYSDGLSVVSLFVQRGILPRAMAGWRQVTINGRTVYSADPDDRSLAWAARGFVFTIIADAPPGTVAEVVAALPQDERPGFWLRLGRGFRRLVSWANPFG